MKFEMWDSTQNCIQNHQFVWKIVGSGLALTGAIYLKGKFNEFQERRHLNQKRTKRQEERKDQFDLLTTKYFLTHKSDTITQLPFEELQSKLQSRELSAKVVLEAFIAKSLLITRDFNCITQFVPQALKWAEELDKLPQVKGPLHGIPVCIKEDLDIEGMDTTLGLSVNLMKPAKKHSVMVQLLVDEGAVPFCKTNLPQTVYSSSSDNPIYGTTVNPLNKMLSPGGSSSGTACLVKAGGAPFGVGTDLGGSVRIPAHFCGLSTLRPTIGRISSKGIVQGAEGLAGALGVPGIIAPRAEIVATLFEIQTVNEKQNKYDPLARPINWNAELYNAKSRLRIGYFTSLPFFPTLGDTSTIVLKAKNALEKMGHTLVPFELPVNCEHMVEVFGTIVLADLGNQNYKKLKYDRVSHVAEKFTKGRTYLSFTFEIIKAITTAQGRSTRILIADPAGQKSEVLWDYLVEQEKIKYKILDKMDKLNLDLILTPTTASPATLVEDTDTLLASCIYTFIWSLVDFPAGVVPFGTETCQNISSYDDQNDFHLKLAKKNIQFAKNMPIGVQIVGKPFKEETVLRVITQLEQCKLN